MSESPSGMSRRAKGLRVGLLSLMLIAVCSMVLPLTAYLWTATVQAQETGQQAAAQPADGKEVNPRATYWREVRDAEPGYTTVKGQETNVLIQSGGQSWREWRNGPVKVLGAIMVLGVLGALLAYQLIKGGSKLQHRTGRKILRWSTADRVLHWYVAVTFLVLTITGLSLLWGRHVLIPVFGKEGFAAWANLAKPIHDYLSLAFVAGLVVMLVKFFHHSLPAKYDLQWLKQVGGYLDDSHPPAGFVNAGEKMFYWTLVIAGAGLVVSGFWLLFPNLGFDRAAMQTANIAHGVTSLILITFVCLHIYLGTLGSEGAFEGMVTGYVDEGWAHQHHSVWFDEVEQAKVGRAVPAAAPPPVGSPTTAST
jgi:formate dehydrogenase subunit gamma